MSFPVFYFYISTRPFNSVSRTFPISNATAESLSSPEKNRRFAFIVCLFFFFGGNKQADGGPAGLRH